MKLRFLLLMACTVLVLDFAALASGQVQAASPHFTVYPLSVDSLIWLEDEVTANNGATNDVFGTSVAVSGTTALIGVPNATVNGNQYQGAAYVFTESNGNWNQTKKLISNDGAGGDHFGYAVALSGTTALVGINNGGTGAVYVFTESGGTWSQTQKLTASDGVVGDAFGASVALDGTTVVVGAPAAGNQAQGAAYVFTESNGVWSQTQKLTASDGAAYFQFGIAVAVSGTTALVGANNNNASRGAAYVFNKSGGNWSQTQKLIASNGAASDQFGTAVAVSGTTALVGAPYGGGQEQGAAYTFNASGGVWSQTQEIIANDSESAGEFGISVALSGTTALVGALSNNSGMGAAYVFNNSGGSWNQTQELVASDVLTSGGFGNSVAFDGSTALIGAPDTFVNINQDQGAAYFEDNVNLALDAAVPAYIQPGSTFIDQTIVTNDNSAPNLVANVEVTMPIPAPAVVSFVGASATQGSCDVIPGTAGPGYVNCDFGPIAGNGGTATANIKLKAIGNNGTTVDYSASVVGATPPLTANAATLVTTDHPPVASDGTLTTNENTAANGTLQATDADGNPLSFIIVTQPTHGSVKINDASKGTFTYTPANNYSGSDAFAWKANDGIADSNTATENVTVNASGGGGSGGGGGSSGGGGGAFGPFALLGLLFYIVSLWLYRRRVYFNQHSGRTLR